MKSNPSFLVLATWIVLKSFVIMVNWPRPFSSFFISQTLRLDSGLSRGFGFITFQDIESVKSALSTELTFRDRRVFDFLWWSPFFWIFFIQANRSNGRTQSSWCPILSLWSSWWKRILSVSEFYLFSSLSSLVLLFFSEALLHHIMVVVMMAMDIRIMGLLPVDIILMVANNHMIVSIVNIPSTSNTLPLLKHRPLKLPINSTKVMINLISSTQVMISILRVNK